jgi:phosphohistidine swiveling domain-containing protein
MKNKLEKNNYKISRGRKAMPNPCYWNPVTQTSREVKKIYGASLIEEINFYTDGSMVQAALEKDWDQCSGFISRKMVEDKLYFDHLVKLTDKRKKEIEYFLSKIRKVDLSRLKSDQLIVLTKKIYKLWADYDLASVLAWFVAGDEYKDRIHDILKISEVDLSILTLPDKKTNASQMEFDLLRYGGSKNINIKKVATNLANKYWWIPFGYDGPEVWDQKHFIDRLKKYQKNINKTQREYLRLELADKKLLQTKKFLLKKYKLDSRKLGLLKIARTLAVWTDDRKQLDYQLNFYYGKVLSELGQKYNLPYQNLKYLFLEELTDAIKNPKKFLAISQKRINSDFMIIVRNGKIRIATDKEIKRFGELAFAEQTNQRETKGTVSSRGNKKIYQGVVRVVLSSSEQSKVNKGEIIVASMTTPDYVPSMQKALGFITDEGGITCHAAIVAREMNKPCIIGTKNATKVFRDGDLVEIDTEKGVIKILKK